MFLGGNDLSMTVIMTKRLLSLTMIPCRTVEKKKITLLFYPIFKLRYTPFFGKKK